MLPFVLDYASVDGNTQRDPARAKAGGMRGLIPRGAYGRRAQPNDKDIYLDSRAMDMSGIRSAGLKTSSYLFVCAPRIGYTTPEPEDQVDAWLDYVLPLMARHQDIIPGIDVEEDSDILNASELFDWYERAAIRAHERLDAWPMFYTSARYWRESLKDHPAGEFAKCPPWVAKPWPWDINQPIQLGDTPSSPTLIPVFGNNWVIYQRQGDALGAPGFNRTTDVNVVRQFGQGAKGQHVEMLQKWLNASGELPSGQALKVDGDFGPKTKTALITAQASYGIDTDGVFGLQSLCALSWVDLG